MPEGPEIEFEKLHESIKEELEHEGGTFLKQISITTAILAVLAAIASSQAGSYVNLALALKTEASRLASESSNQWAYYQAKGVKAAVQESMRTIYHATGKEPPVGYDDKIKRYGEEQLEIQEKALVKEKERDNQLKEADHLFHIHHGFANAVTLFQVSIALGAVAALTRYRLIWIGSLLSGSVGIVIFAWAFTL
jgi:hypothetical protein